MQDSREWPAHRPRGQLRSVAPGCEHSLHLPTAELSSVTRAELSSAAQAQWPSPTWLQRSPVACQERPYHQGTRPRHVTAVTAPDTHKGYSAIRTSRREESEE